MATITCPHCGGRLKRVHRTQLEKVKYSDVYECTRCGRREGALHKKLYLYSRFIFSRYSRCLRCGQDTVQRLDRADKIDHFSKNWLAVFQRLLGAPIHRCSPCRLQFYDWRKPRRRAKPDTSSLGQSAS